MYIIYTIQYNTRQYKTIHISFPNNSINNYNGPCIGKYRLWFPKYSKLVVGTLFVLCIITGDRETLFSAVVKQRILYFGHLARRDGDNVEKDNVWESGEEKGKEECKSSDGWTAITAFFSQMDMSVYNCYSLAQNRHDGRRKFTRKVTDRATTTTTNILVLWTKPPYRGWFNSTPPFTLIEKSLGLCTINGQPLVICV